MKNINRKFKRGFTLMEVLVAATIFAVVMVITTGVIAQGSTYGTKIKTMRETSEETRRLADMITRDVRSANSPLVLNGYGLDWHFKDGLALYYCSGSTASTCSLIRYEYLGSFPVEPTAGSVWATNGTEANALIISTKDGIKIYINSDHSVSTNVQTLFYKAFPLGAVITSDSLIDTRNTGTVISSSTTETMIKFGGHCPLNTTDAIARTLTPSYQQPYIQFFITSKTKNYDSSPKTESATAELRGMVTGRSYNTE